MPNEFRDEVLMIAARVEAEKRLKALRGAMRRAGFTMFSINKVQPDFSPELGWGKGHMYARPGGEVKRGKYRKDWSGTFWDLLNIYKVYTDCGNGRDHIVQAQLAYWPRCNDRLENFIQQRVLNEYPPTEWDLTKEEDDEEAQREGPAGQADQA